MREDANARYMAVLDALGSMIQRNRDDLVFAKYEVERLEKRLEEAMKEIEELNKLKSKE